MSGGQTDISSYFKTNQNKRAHPSTSEESDTSVVFGTPLVNKPERKRQLLYSSDPGSEDSIMANISEALEQIHQRLDALATKEDVSGIKSELKELSETFVKKIEKLEARLFEAEARTDRVEAEVKSIRKKNEEMLNMMRHQENKSLQNERDINDLQQYSRRWNVRVYRVPEVRGETQEDCIQKVCRIFSADVGVATGPEDIEVAHRAGQQSSEKARPIVVRFFDRKKREAVIGARRNLKNKGTVIGEDLTAANYKLSTAAFKHSATMSVWTTNGKVLAKLINGQVVRLNIHMNLDEFFKKMINTANQVGNGNS